MIRVLVFTAALLVIAAPPSRAEAQTAEAERERVSELVERGRRPIRTVKVHPSIWMASGNSNAYLVTTPDGVVVIDTGLAWQGKETRAALLKLAAGKPVRKLVLTHAHEDHVGGTPYWLTGDRDAVEVIAHRHFPERQQYYALLAAYKNRRASVLWEGVMPDGRGMPPEASLVQADLLVDDRIAFELGGIRFEVLSTPGGEGPDAVSVWIPEFGALFTGDALGPTFATFPNLFTLRGENLREPLPMLATLDLMIGLQPTLLLPGHFEPLQGKEKIRQNLTRTRKGLQHVYDSTVAGMNAGKDLWTLMREIEVPEELELSQQYGRVPWGVRAIYELHTGWFRFESTTELYDVPPRDVYADLVELAGGPNIVARRARQHLDAGEPLHALHLAEVALEGAPNSRYALETQLAALRFLERRDAAGNFQLAGWLRHRIGAVRATLDALPEAGNPD